MKKGFLVRAMVDQAVSAGLHYTIFETDMGWVGILASDKGLLRATLPQPLFRNVTNMLGKEIQGAKSSSFGFENLIEHLRSYFSGRRAIFPDILDLSAATPFQRQVWEITRQIPYGETRSYTWVSQKINSPRAVRAAGQALGKNPLPVIIPCHRVLSSNGTIGGFSGGIEMKKRLLQMEGSGVSQKSR